MKKSNFEEVSFFGYWYKQQQQVFFVVHVVLHGI